MDTFTVGEPAFVAPMLAIAGQPPTGAGWAFEFKWDGVRCVSSLGGERARLHSRNANDITRGFPELAQLGALLDGRPVLLDGEIVALNAEGLPDFSLLQRRIHVRRPGPALLAAVPVSYYVFDVLSVEGRSVLDESYQQRRQLLDGLELEGRSSRIRVPANYLDSDGQELLDTAKLHGLEGVVAKRVGSRYEAGRRSPDWTKTALVDTQEVLIGGWVPGEGRRASTLGSLMVGAHDGNGDLRYLGNVGTGFTERMLHELLARLKQLERSESPFGNEVPRDEARRAHWVRPDLVGEVEYRRLTREGRLRHAAWRGLRIDKQPRQVWICGTQMTDPRKRLRDYDAKRDFTVTSEPAGTSHASGEPSAPTSPRQGRRFVVQRHRASRLHYDLRLELGGVLVSWAVPKGPTLDPKARQLAVHVEDHPVGYFDFEGVIPAGQYGGGDVVVWDWGSWQPAGTDDPSAALDQGELHFDLHGEKLAGRFVLIRREHPRSGKDQWLLLHKNDEFAQPGWDPEQHGYSVKSGRTNDEVAASPDVRWHSDRPAAEATDPTHVMKTRRWQPPTDDELAALDSLGRSGAWSVGGLELRLTNLDKVLFPGREGSDASAAVTKRDLVRYHACVAPSMLPYLVNRPVNTHRYPDGVERPGFWHKEMPDYAPDWLNQWHNDEADSGGTECYAVLDSVASLAWMANWGALELHGWTSALPDVHQPTWALIDIDPGEQTSFAEILELARLYRTALEHLQLEAMPKVTGQRGIQIWVPIGAGYSFTDTRQWVETVSRAVGQTLPDLVSWEWHKDRRRGLARLDYTQNAINKTLVTPFSARPAPGAPVSVPITWAELDDPDLRPDRWSVHTVLDRLRQDGDPLAPLIGKPQILPTF